MSATVVNHVPGMLQNLGKTLRVFGKDQTELVGYQLDQDVSGTHPGPRSHKVFSQMLCAIFDQS
jgi:hypothetical protein